MLVLRRARSRKLQPSKNISPSLGPLIQWSVSIESNFQYCPIAMRARRCVVGRWSFVRDAWPPNVHMYTHVTHNVTRYPLHVTRYADVIVHVWDGYTYVSIKSISLLAFVNVPLNLSYPLLDHMLTWTANKAQVDLPWICLIGNQRAGQSSLVEVISTSHSHGFEFLSSIKTKW